MSSFSGMLILTVGTSAVVPGLLCSNTLLLPTIQRIQDHYSTFNHHCLYICIQMKMQVPGQNKDVFTYPYLQTRQSPHNQSIPKLQ